jgi:hypothetical protein
MSQPAVNPLSPVFDPFLYLTEFPLRQEFNPLGFRLELWTNSADVLAAAEEGWGGLPALFDAPPLRVRIAVSDDHSAPSATAITSRAQEHLMAIIAEPGNFAMCDLAGRFVFGWVNPATARNRGWFRYYFLDSIIYLNLWSTDLTRIHASCVARKGKGVLLCGDSGAGKSCLAFACARKGWTFVSDEATSVLRRTEERIVLGKPRQVRFRPAAVEIIPELEGRLAAVNPVGKLSIEVPTSEFPEIETAFHCRAAAVVFLNRQAAGPAKLLPMVKHEAWRRLELDLPRFAPGAHEEHKASLQNLLDAGCFELRYSGLEAAVAGLEALV